MKKSKLLKSIGFASLAVLMGTAGIFAFAPLGASPSVANANEMVDQINTKADGENIKYAPSPLGLDPENDPVIYTTESGLEIKFGGGGLPSGALAGYPYFTMGTYNGYAVNWIIIELPASGVLFDLPYTTFRNYLFELKTPAGKAIANESITHRILSGFSNTSVDLLCDAEIPNGYALCTTECYLGTDRWSSSDSGGPNLFNSAINSRYSTIAGTIPTAQKAFIKDNKFFGFSYNGSYPVTKYLTTNALRVCYNIGTTTAGWWWTNQERGPWVAYAINTGGGIDSSSPESVVGKDDVSLGIRPCMVFKINTILS